jgi:glycosyltransferase involved in cell wall biosynthesis
LRRYAGECSIAITPSVSVAEDLFTAGNRNLRIQAILNGIDLTQYSPEGNRLDLDKLSGLPAAPGGTVRIGLVATMARWKGHEVFLKAIARLPPSLKVRAYVIGGPVYDTAGSQYGIDDLRETAKRVGAENVGFTGYVADTAGVMRALDIVVHASTSPEPFGLVIAEAMACGRPVIYSDAGGAKEIGTHGVNGLSHQPGNVKELAACIVTLINNPALRTQLGNAGHDVAVRRFNRTRLASEFVPVYQELSGSPAIAAPQVC